MGPDDVGGAGGSRGLVGGYELGEKVRSATSDMVDDCCCEMGIGTPMGRVLL